MGVDSNSRHAVWNAKISNKRGEKFLDWLSECGLVVVNSPGHGPTWSRHHKDGLRESHIDVTLVSESLRKKLKDWTLRDDLDEPCDHKIISCRWVNSDTGVSGAHTSGQRRRHKNVCEQFFLTACLA